MFDPVLEANKALVLAHYDAVANRHDPDAIRARQGQNEIAPWVPSWRM